MISKQDPFFKSESNMRDMEENKFLELTERVFPKSLEEEYLKLANSIDTYFLCVGKLSQLSNAEYTQITELQKDYAKNEDFSSEYHEFSKKLEVIMEEVTKDPNSKLLEKALEIARKKESAEKKVKNRDNKTESDRQMHDETHINANQIKEQLDVAMGQIVSSMQSIQAMDQNGQHRIDTLEVREDHFAVIDSFQSFNETEKSQLKELLVEDLRLKITAFKQLEAVAPEIVDKYQNRELVGVSGSLKTAKAGLAICSLENFLLGYGPFQTSIYAELKHAYNTAGKSGQTTVAEYDRALSEYLITGDINGKISEVLENENSKSYTGYEETVDYIKNIETVKNQNNATVENQYNTSAQEQGKFR